MTFDLPTAPKIKNRGRDSFALSMQGSQIAPFQNQNFPFRVLNYRRVHLNCMVQAGHAWRRQPIAK